MFTAPPNVVTIDPRHRQVLLPRGSDEPGMLAAAGPMPRGYWRDEAQDRRDVPRDRRRALHRARRLRDDRRGRHGHPAGARARSASTPAARRSTPKRSRSPRGGTRAWSTQRRRDTTRALRRDRRAGVLGVGADVGRGDHRHGASQSIADYKAPRRVVFVDEVYRAPNGKADYRWARRRRGRRLTSAQVARLR